MGLCSARSLHKDPDPIMINRFANVHKLSAAPLSGQSEGQGGSLNVRHAAIVTYVNGMECLKALVAQYKRFADPQMVC
jgi:hypothetical protein